MKSQAQDLICLIDASGQPMKALKSLTFVPPLRVRHLPVPPDLATVKEEPLVYLLGHCEQLSRTDELLEWMDSLRSADGAPVALLLPRNSFDWCPATMHPQYCGLLPWQPEIRLEAMERILYEARQNLARRWGQGTVQKARFTWSFTTPEAADPERAWLLLESILAGVIGHSVDLSCLGMAFGEALTNAVEHGNLELESGLKDGSNNGLLRFFEERERRLADPDFARRRVKVAVNLHGSRLRVRVRNEGRGYDPSARNRESKAGRTGAGASGLGLTMMESLVDEVRISPDGRTVTMAHRMPRGEHHGLSHGTQGGLQAA